MTSWDDLESEMADPRFELDVDTEDRLLAGLVAPDDAPPAYAEVAGALQTLGRRFPPPDAEAEVATIQVMTEVLRKSTPGPLPRPSLRRRRPVTRVALVLATSLLGTTGVAFAGGLPDAAQSVASDLLAKVGINVPGPDPEAGGHPDTRGNTPVQELSPSAWLDEGHNRRVPERTRGPETDPAHPGDQGDRPASGTQRPDDASHSDESASGASAPPAAVPQDGGKGRADSGSGNADPGTSTADDVSIGRSEAGSTNADEADAEGRERAGASLPNATRQPRGP